MKKLSFLIVLFLTITISSAQTASLDATFNSIDTGFGNGDGANNDVNCITVQTDGKILIAGSFTRYNGTSNNSITRLNADGSLDFSFDVGAGANGNINSLAVQSDGKIVIGGIFTSFDGTPINRIARLNTDGSLDTSFNAGTRANAVIFSIIVQSDDKILVGGNFTTYNGTARARIARLNADGTLDTSFIVGSGFNSFVNSIALQTDGKIIVGGSFTTYNGTSRPRITRLEANGNLDTSFTVSSGANGTVHSIAVLSDGNIIVGGNFTSYNGISMNRIAKLNTNGSIDSGFNVGIGADDTVLAVAIQSDGSILVGGSFTEIDGVSRNRVARLNADGSLDTGFAVGSGFDSQVRAIELQTDGKILIGGYFTNYNNTSKNYLARLETNGSLDSGFAISTGANNEVFALAVQTDGKIIIGGAFTSYNNNTRNYLARLHSDGTLDTTFDVGIGADNTVYAIAVQPDGKILIGGYFNSYNGAPANNIARLNPDGSLDATFDVGTGANGIVYSIAIQQDGKIVIGGEFSAFNEISMNNLARLNVDGSLDTSFTIGTGADWYINSVKIQSDHKILIGGGFTFYNDISRNYMARLNSDGSLDSDFNTEAGADSDVVTMAIQPNGKIIIGGYFTNYNNTSRNHIARLNADGSLDTDFVVGTASSAEVFSLALQEDNKVLIAGLFTSYNGIPVNRLARLNVDGSLDTTLTVGTGANNQINVILLQSNGKVLIGGQLTAYNTIGRNRIARINGFISLQPVSQIPTTFPAFCAGSTIATATGTTTMKFYSSATAITSLSGTALLTNRIYYITEAINGFESSPRVAKTIVVNILPTEVLGAITSNTVSATTTTGFAAATLAVGQYVGTTTPISYRIPAFTGDGLTYLWTLPLGVTIVGSADTNVLSVHYNATASGAGSIGAIKVQAVNSNTCAGTAKSITVSKVLPVATTTIKMTNGASSVPDGGVAAAITTFAPYMGTTTELTLTAKPSLTATSYVWELPTGVVVTNGSATITEGVAESTSNEITVNFSGVTNTNTFNYMTIATFPVATNTLRIGVYSKNGTGLSTTSNATLANSSPLFTPNNTSTARLLTLTAVRPVAPTSLKMYNTLVSSSVAVTDISKFIGTDTELTLIAAVTKLASSYSWELPTTVTVVPGSDLTSNSIKVTFENVPAGTASLYLGVKAVNGIGSSVTNNSALTTPATTSEARLLKVTAVAPSIVGTITGSLRICPTIASDVIYTIATAATRANTYNITVPMGCTINGGTTTTATIVATAGATFTVNYPALFIANATTSIKKIFIQSENGFGVSTTNKSLSLTNVSAVCTPRLADSAVANEFSVVAYPNPSSSEFTIETSAKGAINVNVYDIQGRLVEKTDSTQVGSRLAAGVYNLIVTQDSNVKTLRVIKQ